jgi:hypothetical protein
MLSRLRCAIAVLVTLGSVAIVSAAAPPPGIDPARVKVLLHKLDAERFLTRQKADDALRSMGKDVLPFLRAELARTTSLEVRFRLSRMIDTLTIDERVPGLVKMLGHENAQFGNQAEYALRQAGVYVVPFLRKELRPTLDVQRRTRIEKIIAELSGPAR